MQKPILIGTDREYYIRHLLSNTILAQVRSSEKGKVKIAIEAPPTTEFQRDLWKRVVEILKNPDYTPRGKEIEIVYVESPTVTRSVQKARELEEALDRREFALYLQQGNMKPEEVKEETKQIRKEKKRLTKLRYIVTVLGDRSILRRIENAKPDIIALELERAYVVGKHLGIKLVYLHTEKKYVAKNVERTRGRKGILKRIIAKRAQIEKARRAALARKRRKQAMLAGKRRKPKKI